MSKVRKTIYALCVIAAVAVLAFAWVNEHPVHQNATYASAHSSDTMAPLVGFSVDSIVNAGDAIALDQLPSVGAVIAERILEMRESIGGFRLPEDLLLVKGIGEITLEKIVDALPEPLVQLPEMAE